MEQSKETKLEWTGLQKFDICFCVFLIAIVKVLSLEEILDTRNLDFFKLFWTRFLVLGVKYRFKSGDWKLFWNVVKV